MKDRFGDTIPPLLPVAKKKKPKKKPKEPKREKTEKTVKKKPVLRLILGGKARLIHATEPEQES